CFITVSVGMVRASRCHRLNMKTYIINGSEVSRLSVAIHTTKPNPHSAIFHYLYKSSASIY
ncbi:hypothetical protein, partial [Enterobacter sp. EC_50]|uniref:hypothetical protein n=1 Tax=Enterobacter sp. EC_50 TaxID=2584088 RepID=UPI001C70ACDC